MYPLDNNIGTFGHKIKVFGNKILTLRGRGKVCIVLTDVKLLGAAVISLVRALWSPHVEASWPVACQYDEFVIFLLHYNHMYTHQLRQ